MTSFDHNMYDFVPNAFVALNNTDPDLLSFDEAMSNPDEKAN